ncbi:hypothetical protein SLEP1_g42441 [Rubroshorea leprosula]|uniref:Uncharacterized protein n=1 Tax=Rubroshorea leprosula TaxID=152421 RepID=A0AAV5L9T0_9ROSI|nr:hypothetical protein SLEP1_g42441 [Rubroshorea leprosula]
MTSGRWANPLLCKRFKAILANVDDLIVNLLSLQGLQGEGVVFEVPNALELCSKRMVLLSGCFDFCLPF